jgi:hypothetical protein
VTPPSGSGKKRTISDILGMDAFGTPTDARNHNKKEEQNQTQIKRKKEDPVKTGIFSEFLSNTFHQEQTEKSF